MFVGASSDFTRVIFQTNESLETTPRAPGGIFVNGHYFDFTENLYESDLSEPVAQRVHPVGILPDGTIAAAGSRPGAGGGNIEGQAIKDINHAISSDGSRILFTARADKGAPDPEQNGLSELYDRLRGPTGETIEVSAPAAGAEASKCETPNTNCIPEPAQFWNASEDGSRVLFTSKAELTKQSNTGSENLGNDLYQYNVITKTLTDLTPDSNEGEPNGADVQGVAGASSDGSWAYFVARGVLAPKNAEGNEPASGKNNLYVSHDGAVGFVAILEEPEFVKEGEGTREVGPGDSLDWTAVPEELRAYVTPDGGHLAFTSLAPLTGYDNEDQHIEGKADTEVFEYSTANARLACASCNPNPHVRPVGDAFIGRDTEAQSEATNPFHQPRVLSDDGSRVFFSSPDPLVPESVTPYVKLYEYAGGAVHLISGGSSEGDDIFMDASASGSDVFFGTSQQLAPSDHDGAIDVYDARVEGGFAPPPPPPAAPCEGEACLPPASSPPSFSLPSSTGLNGAGNLSPPPPPVVAKSNTKPLTRAQKLSNALKACRREPRRKRAKCVRLAKRRYGHRARAKRARKVRRRSS